MPRIPDIARPGLSLDVPGAQVSSAGAGAVAEGAARLGAAIEGVSLDLATKIKQAEAQAAVHTSLLNDSIESKKYMDDLELKYPSGYVTDENGVAKKDSKGTPISVSDAYREWADKRYQDTQLAMPSDIAQKAYQQRGAEHFSDGYMKMVGNERVLKLTTYEAQAKSNVKKTKEVLLETPDPNFARKSYQNIANANFANSGVLYNSVVAQKYDVSDRDEIAFSYFDGSLNHAMVAKKVAGKRTADANYVLQTLLGKTKDSDLADMLSPENRSMLTKRAIEASKNATALDKTDAEAGFRNLLQGLESGTIDRRAAIPMATKYAAIIAYDAQGNKMHENVLTEANTKIAVATSKGIFTNDPAFTYGSSQDRRALIEGSQESSRLISQAMKKYGGGEAPIAMLKSELEAKNREITAAQKHDSIAYILNTPLKKSGDILQVDAVDKALRSGDIAGSLNKLGNNTAQGAVRVAKFYNGKAGLPPDEGRIISKEASAALGRLKESTDIQKTNADIMAMQRSFGPHFSEVMLQAIKDGNLSEGWTFAAIFHDNPIENEAVITNLVGGKKIWSAYESTTSKKLSDQQKTALDGAFETEMRPIVGSMLTGSMGSLVTDDMIANVMKVYKTDAVRRLNSMENPDPELAVKQSVARFKSKWVQIPSTTMFVTREYTTPSGNRATITDDQSNDISIFLNAYKREMKPENYMALDPNTIGFDRQLRDSKWIFTQHNGTWGAALLMPGNFAGVKGVEQMLVMNKNKTPVFFPIAELPIMASKKLEELRKDGKSGWNALGDKL